jgi:formiminoglutamase
MTGNWLKISRGDAPLIVSIPHAGTQIPDDIADELVSLWRARQDADWYVDKLYEFAGELGATVIHTTISRSVIDVNRDPSGKSLYPGQPTTELCPTTTFDGEPLYRKGIAPPDATIVVARRLHYFDPYHAAIDDEIARLRADHERVVLFDAHSIRSHVKRLFDGELPNFNIGTNSGAACSRELSRRVEITCNTTRWSHVTDGRFKGGYITRHHGAPQLGVHAIQMELACRGYMEEPAKISEKNWPPIYDASRAAPMRAVLRNVLESCLRFAQSTTVPVASNFMPTHI